MPSLKIFNTNVLSIKHVRHYKIIKLKLKTLSFDMMEMGNETFKGMEY